MANRLNRRSLLQTGAALGAALLLPQAHACEFFSTTLRVLHPWARASAPGASDAVVCMQLDQVQRADRLLAVQTPLASGADIGGVNAGALADLLIPEGRDTLLSETGSYLRLTGLLQPLEIARAYPLTLVFEHGGTVNALLSIDYGGLRFS
jgi:copper(I)-binding protein